MSIFARIMRGEIPCFKVYEDAHSFAFLDINPIARGHTLVIPKEAAERLDALSEAAAAGLGVALVRVARAVVKATGAHAYNVLLNSGSAAGQVVMHAHFHVIPRYAAGAGGLEYEWRAAPLEKGEGAELARRIAEAVG